MTIKQNAKIAILSGKISADGLWLEELRRGFAERGRGDVEFYNCSAQELTAATADLENVKSLSPDAVLIMLDSGLGKIPTSDDLVSFGMALDKLISDALAANITPILATVPNVFGKNVAELTNAAEASLPFCRAVAGIAEKENLILIEAAEEFMVYALELAMESSPYGNPDGTLTQESAKVLGQTVAEQFLG